VLKKGAIYKRNEVIADLNPDGSDWRGVTHYIEPDESAMYSFFPPKNGYHNTVDGNTYTFERRSRKPWEKPPNMVRHVFLHSVGCAKSEYRYFGSARKEKTENGKTTIILE
jgi:hypothetical protein